MINPDKDLELIKPLSWEDVRDKWHQDEKKGWTAEKLSEYGCHDWRQFRWRYWSILGLPQKKWRLWRVKDIQKTIPEMNIGTFSRWQKWVPNWEEGTFSEVAKSPEMQENPKINKIANDFWGGHTLIGFKMKDKIVILEGHHRATAIAVATARGLDLSGEVFVALADMEEDETLDVAAIIAEAERSKQLFLALEDLDICYQFYEHEPVFTVEEAAKVCQNIPGAHTKNLFLRDEKKQNYFLVTIPARKKVDLKSLSEKLGHKKLSFACADDLWKYLQLQPGSVSSLGLLNDADKKVTFVLDRDLDRAPEIAMHPNNNSATLVMPRAGLVKFLQKWGGEMRVMEI